MAYGEYLGDWHNYFVLKRFGMPLIMFQISQCFEKAIWSSQAEYFQTRNTIYFKWNIFLSFFPPNKPPILKKAFLKKHSLCPNLTFSTRQINWALFLKCLYCVPWHAYKLNAGTAEPHCRNNYFMHNVRNLFPLFKLRHIVLISTPHKTFVLFTVPYFEWMRFICFVDVIKYGILVLMVIKSYGNTLHHVFVMMQY